VGLALLTGCDNPFAPALDDAAADGRSIMGDQTQVEGVFVNFKQAYAFRDSTIYGQLLAPEFVFTYLDYDKGFTVSWGRDDEMRSTYGLFQNVQKLDLVWNTVITSTVDPDSLTATVVRNFNLTVTFSPSDIVRVDGYANMKLQRDAGTRLWRITRWQDVSNF
jgi:hypothetical protein